MRKGWVSRTMAIVGVGAMLCAVGERAEAQTCEPELVAASEDEVRQAVASRDAILVRTPSGVRAFRDAEGFELGASLLSTPLDPSGQLAATDEVIVVGDYDNERVFVLRWDEGAGQWGDAIEIASPVAPASGRGRFGRGVAIDGDRVFVGQQQLEQRWTEGGIEPLSEQHSTFYVYEYNAVNGTYDLVEHVVDPSMAGRADAAGALAFGDGAVAMSAVTEYALMSQASNDPSAAGVFLFEEVDGSFVQVGRFFSEPPGPFGVNMVGGEPFFDSATGRFYVPMGHQVGIIERDENGEWRAGSAVPVSDVLPGAVSGHLLGARVERLSDTRLLELSWYDVEQAGGALRDNVQSQEFPFEEAGGEFANVVAYGAAREEFAMMVAHFYDNSWRSRLYGVRFNCCGDGRHDPLEACDDGPDNSDTEPDACRTTCQLPRCGDGVIDSGESCEGEDFGEFSVECSENEPRYVDGQLSCNAACAIDEGACVEADQRSCYRDADGDGRAGSAVAVYEFIPCEDEGYSATNEDCNDDPEDACAELSWTDAEERCDGCDNDCNGEVDTDAFPRLGVFCGDSPYCDIANYVCSPSGDHVVCEVYPSSVGVKGPCDLDEYEDPNDDVDASSSSGADDGCSSSRARGVPLGLVGFVLIALLGRRRPAETR